MWYYEYVISDITVRLRRFWYLPQTFMKKISQISLIPGKILTFNYQLRVIWNHYWLFTQSQLKLHQNNVLCYAQKQPTEVFSEKRCSQKFLKIQKTPFLIILQSRGLQLYWKRDSDTGVSCEFCEIFKSNYLIDHIWLIAFVCNW